MGWINLPIYNMYYIDYRPTGVAQGVPSRTRPPAGNSSSNTAALNAQGNARRNRTALFDYGANKNVVRRFLHCKLRPSIWIVKILVITGYICLSEVADTCILFA